jgi:hypothetical protein
VPAFLVVFVEGFYDPVRLIAKNSVQGNGRNDVRARKYVSKPLSAPNDRIVWVETGLGLVEAPGRNRTDKAA